MLNKLIVHLQLLNQASGTVWVETQPKLKRDNPYQDVWCIAEMKGIFKPTDLNPLNWDKVSGLLVLRGTKWYLPMLVQSRTNEYVERRDPSKPPRKIKMADIEPYLPPNSGTTGFKTIDMHSIVKLQIPSIHWEAERWSNC